MTISVRLSEEDTTLFKKYAEFLGLSVSEMVRQSVLARIEEDHDLKCYEQAMAEFARDPVTYSLDEVEKELGLR